MFTKSVDSILKSFNSNIKALEQLVEDNKTKAVKAEYESAQLREHANILRTEALHAEEVASKIKALIS